MTPEKLLTVKELAFELRRSTKFVYAMRALGFEMPGGTATVTEARAWLMKNPSPCRQKRAPLPNRSK
jgi:hypothetical protein